MLRPRNAAAPRGSSSRNRRKKETPEDILRRLQRLPGNKTCADCGTKLPGSVCLNFYTFVCTVCAGIHREFSHRIKGVGHSAFTEGEMERIQREDSGNAAVNAIYMARYDQKSERLRPPVDNSDQQLCRVWIRRKYIDKTWYEPPAKDESKDQKVQGKSKSSDGADANYIKPTIVAIPKLGAKSTAKEKEEQPVADLFAAWSTDEPAIETPVAASLSNASNTDGDGDDWDAFGGSSATNAVTSGLVNESFQANFDNAFQANFDTTTNSESGNLDPNDDFLAIASKAKANDDSLFSTNFENAFQDALSSEKQIKQQQSQAEPIFSANFSNPSSKPQQIPANISAFAVDFDAKTVPPYMKKEGNPFAQLQQTNDSQPPLMPPSLTTTVAPLSETQKQGNLFAQHQSDITSKTHLVPNVMSQNNGIGMTSNTQIQSIGAALPNQMQVNVNVGQSASNSSTLQSDSDQKVGTQSELKTVEQKPANISTIDNAFVDLALDETASSCEVSAITHDVGMITVSKSMSSQVGMQSNANLTQNARSFAMKNIPSVSSAPQQDPTECLAAEDKFAGLALDEGAISLGERENMKKVAPVDEVAVIEQNVDMINSPRHTKSKQLPTVPHNEDTICPFPNPSVDSGAVKSGLSMNDNLHISYVQNCGSAPLPLIQGNLVNNMQPSNLQSSENIATLNGQQQINNTNVVFNQKAATSDNSNSNSTGVTSDQQHAKNLLSPSHQVPPTSVSFGGSSVSSGGMANGQPQLNGTNVAVQAPMVHGGISQQQIQLLQLMQSMSPEQIQQMQLMMQMQAMPQTAMTMQQVAMNQNMQFTNNFSQNQENMPHEQMNNSSQGIYTFNQGPATHQMVANQQQNHLLRQFHQNVPNQQMQFHNEQGNLENMPVQQMKTFHNFPRGGHPGQGGNP